MINVDGVIIGNNRTSLSGNDLNRKYMQPNKNLHPEIYWLKKMAKSIVSNGEKIFLFLDIHAHS